jgi:hypothetical protein
VRGVTDEPSTEGTPQSTASAEGQKKAKILVAVLIPVVLLVAALTWYGSTNAERTAKHQCAEAVRGRLLAPATAKFHYQEVSKDGAEWTVVGNVDSANRYGVPLRSGFQCTVTDKGATVDTLDSN